mmetsp:Transcript_22947/g.28153  ORF Transcript_22947/g.28153 Transcript_22947/m.28153 type:complete len:350 (+) Transcript_22947:58-1107(+)
MDLLTEEYLTGLILTNRNHENDLVASSTTPLKRNVVSALRILRDTNPSLKAKISRDNAIDDIFLEHWNSVQEIITLNDEFEIKKLNLGGMMVRIKTIVPFMEALAQSEHGNQIRVLSLGGTDIPMSNLLKAMNVTHVANAGNGHESFPLTYIESLYLSGCGISSQRNGIRDLATILQHCTHLKTLDLRYNDLVSSTNHNDVIELIAECLPKTNIEVLHMEGNNINDDIAKGFKVALSSASIRWKELYLGSNNIKSRGAICIADGLKHNETLIKLYIECNFIGNEGTHAFIQVLGNQKMEDNENNSKDDKKIPVNIALQKLWVENNGVGKEMMRELGKALNSGSIIGDSL